MVNIASWYSKPQRMAMGVYAGDAAAAVWVLYRPTSTYNTQLLGKKEILKSKSERKFFVWSMQVLN